MPRSVFVDSVSEGIERHNFGTSDTKGRAIGCTVEFEVHVFEEAYPEKVAVFDKEPGTYYAFRTRATRNGEPFGAYQPWNRFPTEKGRYEAVAKYLKGAAKRAAK